MSVSIWKFSLGNDIVKTIKMPVGSKILCVKNQFEMGTIWALVNILQSNTENRVFHSYMTGEVIADLKDEYIGTYQLTGGNTIVHVFEKHKL